VAFRHELRDTHGTYIGTFVTDTKRWQIGDAFTDGDGRALRITDLATPEHSNQRPTYTDRWIVEPIQPATSQRDTQVVIRPQLKRPGFPRGVGPAVAQPSVS